MDDGIPIRVPPNPSTKPTTMPMPTESKMPLHKSAHHIRAARPKVGSRKATSEPPRVGVTVLMVFPPVHWKLSRNYSPRILRLARTMRSPMRYRSFYSLRNQRLQNFNRSPQSAKLCPDLRASIRATYLHPLSARSQHQGAASPCGRDAALSRVGRVGTTQGQLALHKTVRDTRHGRRLDLFDGRQPPAATYCRRKPAQKARRAAPDPRQWRGPSCAPDAAGQWPPSAARPPKTRPLWPFFRLLFASSRRSVSQSKYISNAN